MAVKNSAMSDREAMLRAYMEAAGPVVWGESDCCAFVAGWIAIATGRTLRLPKYASQDEALALIKAAGGLVPLCERVLAPLHLAPTATPGLGDIGVVRLSIGDRGAIFAADGIALLRREPAGCVFMRPKTILAAWAV